MPVLTAFHAVALGVAGQRLAHILQQSALVAGLARHVGTVGPVGTHTDAHAVHLPAFVGQETHLTAAVGHLLA